MEKDIKIGAEGDLDIKLDGGKVTLVATYNGAGGTAALTVSLGAKYFLEKLKAALPQNTFVDGAIDAVEAAVGG